jgi:hypothetical protein
MADTVERLCPVLWDYHLKDQIIELRRAGVLTLPIAIPWDMIAPHEKQAQANHSQTLSQLADRGGLGPAEALAILDDRRWHSMPLAAACRELNGRIAAWIAASK